MTAKPKKKLALSTQIFIALILAIGAGVALTGNPDIAKNYIKPFGTIFLNLIKWIVCPLVFFSIMAGVISMKDIKKVGIIGGTTVLFYLCTTAFAVAIGLLFANLLKGIFPVLSTANLSYDASASSVNFMDTLVGIFPSNFVKPFVDANMLQIIVMSLIIGFALIMISPRVNKEFHFVSLPSELKQLNLVYQETYSHAHGNFIDCDFYKHHLSDRFQSWYCNQTTQQSLLNLCIISTTSLHMNKN